MALQFRSLTWPTGTPFKRLERVDYLVVHHSEGSDVPIEEVDRWHKQKGWLGVGYHFYIRQNGAVEIGRPEWARGAHVLNYNDRSIGICLAGDFMKSIPTMAQMESLVDLLKMLQRKYPEAKVMAHRHLRPTACPGVNFPWDELQERLRGGDGMFGDIAGHWAEGEIRAAAEIGVVAKAEQFRPDDNLTRAEAVALLMRLYRLLTQKGA